MNVNRALLAALLGTAFLVGVFVFFLGGEKPGTTLGEAQLSELVAEARHIRGAAANETGTAPVTIVEFSDFQCPACRLAQGPLKQLLDKYPTQIRLIYRHFPLTQIHSNAFLAAQASEAADNQGRFWEMHDRLFAGQESWADLGTEQTRQQFEFYAQELGLDPEQFSQDLTDAQTKALAQEDLNLALRELGLNSTPTFFVNSKKLDRSLSLSDWEKEIAPYLR